MRGNGPKMNNYYADYHMYCNGRRWFLNSDFAVCQPHHNHGLTWHKVHKTKKLHSGPFDDLVSSSMYKHSSNDLLLQIKSGFCRIRLALRTNVNEYWRIKCCWWIWFWSESTDPNYLFNLHGRSILLNSLKKLFKLN